MRHPLVLLFAVMCLCPPAQAQLRDHFGDPLPPGAVARLGTMRLRHPEEILSLAFSPDGRCLASGGHDATVRLWDTVSGKLVRALPGHTHGVRCVAFSPDGRRLAVAGERSNLAYLWDCKNGKLLRSWEAQRGWTTAVVFSPDGKLLATGDNINAIHLWDAASAKQVRTLAHSGHHLAFSPDGKELAAAGDSDGRVLRWEVATGKELPALGNKVRNSTTCVAFSPDGKYLAASIEMHWGVVWDRSTVTEVARFEVDAPGPLAFSPDSQLLAAAGSKGTVLWDVTARRLRRTLKPTLVRALAFSPDGHTLAISHGQTLYSVARISLWDPATGRQTLFSPGHESWVGSVAFSPAARGGNGLIASVDQGAAIIWDAERFRELHHLTVKDDHFDAVAFAPDGKTLALATRLGKVHLVNPRTGIRLRVLDSGLSKCFEPFLAYSPDGKILAASWRNRPIHLWDAATGRALRSIPCDEILDEFAWSPDGKTLASIGWGIFLWDVATGKRLRRLDRGEGCYRVAYSPDGKTIRACLPPTGRLRLWDATSGRMVRTWPKTEIRYRVLAFSPDGKTLVLRRDEGQVELWSAAGECLHVLRGHEGFLDSIAFAPDSRTLASSGRDGTILLWDVDGPNSKRHPLRLSDHDLEIFYRDLAGINAHQAQAAIWTLAANPDRAVPLLKKYLHPVPTVTADKLRQLIADLDSDHFAVREKATRELASLGERAVPALRQALANRPSPELRHRAERLLRQAKRVERTPAERLALRCVSVLEQAATPEARALLRQLAHGAPGARLTEDAAAALRRLLRR